jgi:hypothetical protein
MRKGNDCFKLGKYHLYFQLDALFNKTRTNLTAYPCLQNYEIIKTNSNV